MKSSKSAIHRKIHGVPEFHFEDHRLTSFAGLALFQLLFSQLGFKAQLNRCFRHLKVSPIFGHGTIVLLLVVHLLIGYRRLQDVRYYDDDPMVRRVLGLSRLPDVATISRTLAGIDAHSADNLRRLNRDQVLRRLDALGLVRVTLDFDGSVIATGRFAEGTAVGFNRQKRGRRSYYPLFCTIAQSGQVLDVWHRPGNVHDSSGAKAFMGNATTAFAVASRKSSLQSGSLRTMAIQGGTAMQLPGRQGFVSTPYERHQPEQTLLYQLVETHYPALVDQLAQHGKSLPDHVHREFDSFLKCGRLEHGFLRVRCDKCHFERLVAFSCKKRGFCPSCGARRMAETAALLADEVFPDVPLRQWVISLTHSTRCARGAGSPFPLRYLFAAYPQAMGKVLGIIYRAISTHLIHKAGLSLRDGATGAVTLIQRFGSALNLNMPQGTLS